MLQRLTEPLSTRRVKNVVARWMPIIRPAVRVNRALGPRSRGGDAPFSKRSRSFECERPTKGTCVARWTREANGHKRTKYDSESSSMA